MRTVASIRWNTMSSHSAATTRSRRPFLIAGAVIAGTLLMLASFPSRSSIEVHVGAQIAAAILLVVLITAAWRGSILAWQALATGIATIATIALLRALNNVPLSPGLTLILSAAGCVWALAAFETFAPRTARQR